MDVKNDGKNFLKNGWWWRKFLIFLKKWKNRNNEPPGGGRGKKIKDIVPFYWGKFN